ncbi:MAG: hypothetical protein NT010_05620 [Proteobacteria bacterium]|nr:hypothetical protein [Pseudomonadota bacterium]
MKKVAQITMVVVIGFVLAASTGYTADKKYSGFLGDNYKNLQPGPEGGVKERWLKPGVTFGKYN